MGKIFQFEDVPETTRPGQVGRKNYGLVTDKLGANKIHVSYTEYEPNMVQSHYHYHKEREQVIIGLDGSAQYELNGVEYTIKANTVVFIAAGDKHGVKGAGKDGFKMLEINSPPYGGDMFEVDE